MKFQKDNTEIIIIKFFIYTVGSNTNLDITNKSNHVPNI